MRLVYVGVTACLRAPPSHVNDIPCRQFRLDMRVAQLVYTRISSSHHTPFWHQTSFHKRKWFLLPSPSVLTLQGADIGSLLRGNQHPPFFIIYTILESCLTFGPLPKSCVRLSVQPVSSPVFSSATFVSATTVQKTTVFIMRGVMLYAVCQVF